MKKILLYIISVVWQLPQCLLARVVWSFYKMRGTITDTICLTDGIIVCIVRSGRPWGVSFGRLIFVSSRYSANDRIGDVVRHEYGHSLQSRYLGWLYLIVIALPSLVVTGVSPAIAGRCYFEKWADKLGDKALIIYR
jgi:hypothetical protein